MTKWRERIALLIAPWLGDYRKAEVGNAQISLPIILPTAPKATIIFSGENGRTIFVAGPETERRG